MRNTDVEAATRTNEHRTSRGTDDKIGKGIDVALVTLAFLGIGYGLDRWLDTKPVFMIVLVVLALVGEFLRFWYDYDARMKVLEAQRASARARRPPMNDIAFSMAAPLPGPAPEVTVSNDMVKRGLMVAPVLIAVVRR